MSQSTPLTVTELTARIKQVLEQGFAQVEVTGEISRLTHPSSGHLYFSIKDAHAAISAVVWRTTAVRLKTRPMEGQAYIFIGHLSLYEPRGTYQLVIQRIEALGAGRLAAEFERRKQSFADCGWFDPKHKLKIPELPRHIGIITSATAAAFEDVKKVLATRPGWLNFTLSPCLVQGEKAVHTIVAALEHLQSLADKPDVILLVRGGGSIEDLWCFNDEKIVSAVFKSKIPIITGIGHEIDTTLVDLAADLRAATPSNAAELACPSRQTLHQQLPQLSSMASLLARKTTHARAEVLHLEKRQKQAFHRYQDGKNWALERLISKTLSAFRQHNHSYRNSIREYHHRLQLQEPNQLLRRDMQQLLKLKGQLATFSTAISYSKKELANQKKRQLHFSYEKSRQQNKQQWQRLNEQLHSMNPRHVLQRGYAITTNQQNDIISSASGLQENDILQLHFHDGSAKTKVLQISKSRTPEI